MSQPLIRALEMVRRVAPTNLNVLITGETGTGKELFARALHRSSRRRDEAFIAVNCAAIPDSLFEAELFGHARGAFTGAATARAGRFAAASGGTLFLDEIGDLPLAAQAKLLRVLENGTITPLGSDLETQVDVRVVAATHRNLEEMVEKGTFRADLYFRLAVITTELPSLRERTDDLPLLLAAAIASANRRTSNQVTGVSAVTMGLLGAYSWPGNVRELAHRIDRAVVLTGQGEIKPEDLLLPVPRHEVRASERLGAPGRGTPSVPSIAVGDDDLGLAEGTRTDIAPARSIGDRPLNLRNALEHLERRLIDEALTQSGGNRTVAAALLGLNRTTLAEKLRKYGT